METKDSHALNGLFNTALATHAPYAVHQETHAQAKHLETRLLRLAELEKISSAVTQTAAPDGTARQQIEPAREGRDADSQTARA